MIELTNSEKRMILACKQGEGSYIDRLKPQYKEEYGYDPDDQAYSMYGTFLGCMFHRLFDLFMKISDDRSGEYRDIKDIITASFDDPFGMNKNETPMERVVNKLVVLIRLNRVILDNGDARYSLDVEE